MTEAQSRRWYPLILLVVGLLLFFPGLSAFGLWDPYEIRIADAARALSLQPEWTWGPQAGKPPLLIWLIAAGFKLIGVGELGGRLPIAMVSLATLLATYYAGIPLVGRRGALLGGIALATAPVFFMGARQLTSDAPMMLGAVLAVGGLARAAWPANDESPARRGLDLLLGIAGLVIGQFSSGLLVGVIAPVAAVTLGVALASGASGVIAAGGAITVGLIGYATYEWRLRTGYSPVLGGIPHPLLHATVVTSHLTRLGFGLFPWIALAPIAIYQALDGGFGKRFGGLLLLSWVLTTYLAGTVHAAGIQDLHLPLGPAFMLLIGGLIDVLLRDARPLPFAGITVTLGALILGRDFFIFPENFVAVHMIESVRWPGPLTHVPYVVMAFAAFFGGVMGFAIGAPLAPPSGTPAVRDEKRRRGRLLLVTAGAGSALLLALVVNHWVIPEVSKHLSARDLYGRSKALDPNAPVGQYRFNATGAAYYTSGKTPQTLNTTDDLFTFLARAERVFVMAGSDELANIDQQARQKKATYVVVDDSNSRYLMLSNKLAGEEKDLNPLRRFILDHDQPPTPQNKVEVDFEGKVQLLGYDLPPQLARGQDFKIRLYFKVLQPLGASYKVFIHFDGPGARFNGDHVPMEGRFPTQNWVPGYYIIDEHEMKPDRATQPSGYYRVFMGFFAGDARLKVTSGPQDGENRVKLGAVNIK